MGNKLGRRRQMVDERYTRPQGLYHHKDVDHKKLRKLILDSKLAPCYPGDDDCQHDLEECPICFLYYPSLNRSRCCMKGICTECFLQMKNPDSARPTQCPFCKASNYAVEYRGVKSKEEKGMERIEEQRVIEAKIRIRQKEIDEEERMHKRHGTSSACRMEHADHDSTSASPVRSSAHDQGHATSQESGPLVRRLHTRHNREDEFDLDLEEIMVMEAIWLSIQNGTGEAANKVVGGDCSCRVIDESSSSSRSGGLACAIAALAEQQVEGEAFTSSSRRNVSARDISPPGSGHSSPTAAAVRGDAEENTTYFPSLTGPIIPDSFEEQMMLAMALSLADSRSRISAQGVAWQ